MSDELFALLAGAVLAVGAIAYVIYPLFFRERATVSLPTVGAQAHADAIEARVRALRESHLSCPSCGIRPEHDAQYCSSCGRFLGARPTAR